MKHPKWLNSELVFYLAVFFLPFENFFFAPSSGWAAISPVIFALYVILNYKLVFKALIKLRKIIIFFLVAIILGSATAFLNSVNTVDYLNSFVPLALGAVSLFSFFIFYQKKKDLSTVINLVVISYAICAVIGLFEYLALKLGNDSFATWLSHFFKRNYLTTNHRVQFFFTEPSFIGMHLFGVLLPLYWLSRRKDLLFIIGLFIVEAICFGSGVRIVVDFAVVATFYLIYFLQKHRKLGFLPLILLIFALIFGFIYSNNARVRRIVSDGVYADGSLATRYFRIESSAIGYTKAPGKAIVGFGLGNAIKPIHLGYDEAYANYSAKYQREVRDLDRRSVVFHDDAVAYSLFIRFISEFGLILSIIALVFLIRITKSSILPERWLYLFIVLYLYVQFESLGFYALWLFIVTMLYTSREKMTKKVLNRRISDNIFRRKK